MAKARLLAGASAVAAALMLSGCVVEAMEVQSYSAPPPAWADITGFDEYEWIDRADAISEAIGEAPPDTSFVAYGTEPWAWTLQDGSVLIVEREADGLHSYYFESGSDEPFLVRGPDIAFGYLEARLAVVYSSDGQILARGDASGWPRLAAVSRERGRSLKRAMLRRDQWRSVEVSLWVDFMPFWTDWQYQWNEGKRRHPGWRRHQGKPDAQRWRHKFDGEHHRRRGIAEGFNRWRQGGFQGPRPGNWTPPPQGWTGPGRGGGRPGDPGRPGRPGGPGGRPQPQTPVTADPTGPRNPRPVRVPGDGVTVTPDLTMPVPVVGRPARPPRPEGGRVRDPQNPIELVEPVTGTPPPPPVVTRPRGDYPRPVRPVREVAPPPPAATEAPPFIVPPAPPPPPPVRERPVLRDGWTPPQRSQPAPAFLPPPPPPPVYVAPPPPPVYVAPPPPPPVYVAPPPPPPPVYSPPPPPPPPPPAPPRPTVERSVDPD